MAGDMVCVVCNRTIAKSGYKIQCQDKCDGWAHLGCTDVNKEDVIKKRKIQWSCSNCKKSDKSEESDDDILEELVEKLGKRRSLERSKKSGEESNIEGMFNKLIKKIEGLEEAVSFNSEVVDGMRKTMEEIKKENRNIKKEQEKMKDEMYKMRSELDELKEQARMNATMAEAQSRRKNLIMVGLRTKEEVPEVLNKFEINVPENEIKIRQLPSRQENKPILVEFSNEKVKNLVLQKRKLMGSLNSVDMGLEGETRRIYINEDLPKEIQELLRKAKELKTVGFKYVWCKENKILCRKGEYTKIIHLKNTKQIDDLKAKN